MNRAGPARGEPSVVFEAAAVCPIALRSLRWRNGLQSSLADAERVNPPLSDVSLTGSRTRILQSSEIDKLSRSRRGISRMGRSCCGAAGLFAVPRRVLRLREVRRFCAPAWQSEARATPRAGARCALVLFRDRSKSSHLPPPTSPPRTVCEVRCARSSGPRFGLSLGFPSSNRAARPWAAATLRAVLAERQAQCLSWLSCGGCRLLECAARRVGVPSE